MPIQNTNMFKTQSPYDQQIEELKRRQQMAEMLQQQSMQPLESQVAPGGMVVPTSPVLGLTKMLQAYLGGKQLRDIEKQRGETEKGARSEALDYLRSFNPEQKTIGMGEAAVNQLPMPQVGNNGQVSYQAPSVTAMPNARPVASLDQPMQMQVGGPLNRQDQMRRSEEGILSDNPLVRALAQTKYEAANKTVNPMDYLGKFDPDKLTPESLKSLQADIAAGRTPDVGGLTFIKKPVEPKTLLTSPLAKLLAERDALPEGDPNIKVYNSMITKETTTPQPVKFDVDTIKDLASRFIAGDKTASYGLGRSQSALMAFNAEVARQRRERGDSPTAIADQQRRLKVQGQTETDFTSGKSAAIVQSMNTFTQHSNHLYELADALDRGDITAINAAKIAWQNATGQPAPNDLSLVGQLVADELQKAALGSPGGQEERLALKERLTGAKSAAVIKSAIEQGRGLVKGQLGSLQQRWSAGYGDPEQFAERFLTEDARNLFNKKPPPPANLPPQASSQLKEGQVTTFGNGQRWTLKNGIPVQVQ
jgi:hypothetical protein